MSKPLLIGLCLLLIAPMVAVAQNGLRYTENKNQWLEPVLFRAHLPQGSVYVEPNALTFDLGNGDDLEQIHYIKENSLETDPSDILIRRHAYRLHFEGSMGATQILKEVKSVDYENYLLGSDQTKWATRVHHYTQVTLQSIYPYVDAVCYSSGNNMKYDIVVHPGGDWQDVKIKWEGVQNLRIENEMLLGDLSFSKVMEAKPIAYQVIEGDTQYVDCVYKLTDNLVSFELGSSYNNQWPLVIDPEMIFSTYSGSTEDNWGFTATYDLEGHLYGGGIVFGTGYPTTLGAYDVTFNSGDIDMAVTKFNPDGSSLIWSTYLGGSNSDQPQSLVANTAGELYVYGTTGSSNYPVTAGAFDESFNGGDLIYISIIGFNGTDIVLSCLSEDGSTLLYSTYVGGSENDGLNIASATEYNYGDHSRGEVYLDESGFVYVASSTYSADFPVTSGAYDEIYGGNQDGVVFKMNPSLDNMEWCTYLGSTSADGAYSVKATGSGQAVVGGGTASSTFPTTAGVWFDTYQGGSADGFVSIISADGSDLVASSFIGTNQYDQVYFVELDDDFEVYVTGQTKGTFPVSDDVYSNSGGKQFIAKLETDLSSEVYSTIFGSGSSAVNISPSAFLVDECENVYVSGWGGNVNIGHNPATGTTSGMPVTADALDATTDGSDFYFIVLEKNAVDILYGSFYGGPGNEHVDGGTSRFDKEGTIYQAVCAGCGGSDLFPTTDGSWSEINGSFNCNLGVGKININLGGVYAISAAEPDIIGCAPFTVYFDNLSSDADQYLWDFGDGVGTSTTFEPIYTYTDSGVYTVTLIVIDSASCNIADTTSLIVTVFGDSMSADFEYVSIQDCDELTATFTTLTELGDAATVQWFFGDGTSSTSINPEHTYTEPGTYEVMFIVTDPFSCNYSDTAFATISFLSDFSEAYSITSDGCLPVTITITSDIVGADSYTWTFHDGSTATGPVVTYTYEEIGLFNISLEVIVCGISDVTNIPINVIGFPVAYFNAYPELGLIQAPIDFYNGSTGAIYYDWYFGDGGYSDEENPSYTYNTLGTFEVCLTATNEADCSDTYCRSVTIEKDGAIGVPNAFTPNGDGSNDVLFVRGFGIKTLEFSVFNRWGQEVFSTSDQTVGWDGTFKGVLQEMDVYIYTLSATFYDGETYSEKGNVTLIY